jgi:hypothetical protein
VTRILILTEIASHLPHFPDNDGSRCFRASVYLLPLQPGFLCQFALRTRGQQLVRFGIAAGQRPITAGETAPDENNTAADEHQNTGPELDGDINGHICLQAGPAEEAKANPSLTATKGRPGSMASPIATR